MRETMLNIPIAGSFIGTPSTSSNGITWTASPPAAFAACGSSASDSGVETPP
jgi:hypothetical protein